MEKKMYFDKPTQVVWVDEDGQKQAGIAFHDVVICGCCGGTTEIWEIYEFAPEDVEYPITELEWTEIREEIGGDWLYPEVENEV